MIRILVTADTRLYRDGLVLHLERQPGIDVVGTAASRADACRLVAELRPDVVLLDMAMADGLAAVRELGGLAPAVRVVALAVPDADHAVLACAEAGIAGYVTRDGSLADLVATVQSAARGELLISPRMAARLLAHVSVLAADRTPAASRAELTAREGDIARLLDQGLSNKQIAARLGIEPTTAKNHVHNILEKLKVHRRRDVAKQLQHEPPRLNHL